MDEVPAINAINIVSGGALFAVCHPGFHVSKGWGSDDPPGSRCYVEPKNRKVYYCGGFQGGSYTRYYKACSTMAANIAMDEREDKMAKWHDESHWNWYLNEFRAGRTPYVDLYHVGPEYMMPELAVDAIKWGLKSIKPIILALNKNHKVIRA
jgi:hypothetical protein